MSTNTPPTSRPAAQSESSETKPAHVFSEKLERLSGDSSATHAVILVGGIHSNHDYFKEWVPALSSKDNAVLGFDHDHQAMSMKEAASSLANSIKELKAQGITDVTIVAHSMGGLVSKGAVDELSRTGAAAEFKSIDLHAMGTPWGGFAVGDLARYTPGSEFISKAVGFPMGPEIGPGSDYMKSLAQPMPANGELHIYKGDIDKVATPAMDSTRERYASIEKNAMSATDMEGFGHNDYKKAPPEVLEVSRDAPVPGFDTRAAEPAPKAEAQTQAKETSERVASADAGAAMSM